jgi:hypothetical protein
MTKITNARVSVIGNWNLNIFWDLLFGAWNFINPEIQSDVNARIG